MTDLELLELASSTFAERLAAVRPEQWDAPTPCEGWSVGDLVAHVVGGNAMAVALLSGAGTEQATELFTGTVLADDVVAQFADGAAAQVAAFAEDGAAGRVLHHPMGDLPGSVVLGFRIGDLTLHAWDLARATGGDEALPEALVASVHASLEPMGPMLAATGMFGEGASGNASAEAPLQDRLLDLAGRRP